ncbi:MAG TPA: hypothetical protein VGS97_11005 [Actinocrinis sp.]|uniref:hypothetical protein n=1 Tax=Actinocrinis sp. TaxID=1920516 RepID=UPI002DDCA6E4|nr:hypothetical protein [Actinocrinis sp.]HEV2344612.1 hypothetical protein [Actinocrinis sp.]
MPGAAPEVDAHHDAHHDAHYDAQGSGPAGLVEPGGGEDAAAADVQFAPDDFLPRLDDHRVTLKRTGAAFPGEADRRGRQARSSTGSARHSAAAV